MIVSLKPGAPQAAARRVSDKLRAHGFEPREILGVERIVLAAVGRGERKEALLASLQCDPEVETAVALTSPYKLVHRSANPAGTTVEASGVRFGPGEFTVIAGPCSVESRAQILETARAVKAAGARMLRGGAYKPRTSPYDFQGLEGRGLALLTEARAETGLPFVTEVLTAEDVDAVAEASDMLQVGARNMQNFALLKRLGGCGKPVLLKRGLSATIQELLLAAEYVVAHGNPGVVLCERGIRTFETHTRNTLDLGAVAALRELTHLPIVVDPSHATGRRSLVPPLAKAAAAVGADGLIIEVHPRPEEAWSDGPQSVTPASLAALLRDLAPYAQLEGRRFSQPEPARRATGTEGW